MHRGHNIKSLEDVYKYANEKSEEQIRIYQQVLNLEKKLNELAIQHDFNGKWGLMIEKIQMEIVSSYDDIKNSLDNERDSQISNFQSMSQELAELFEKSVKIPDNIKDITNLWKYKYFFCGFKNKG